VPASATATGTAGSIAQDANYIYVATAANTWKRSPLQLWLPASTSLQLWLDASDGQSLFDATSGGSLVGADGAVARWQDKSGNGRHATQATQSLRPLRKTAIANGYDVLRFDGLDDTLRASNLFNATTDYTIFCVGRGDTINDDGRGFLSLAPTAELTNGYFAYIYRNDIANKARALFTTDGTSGNISSDSPNGISYTAVHCMSAIHTASNREWWINGVSQGAANGASGSAAFSSAELRVGWYYARSSAAGFYSLAGDLCEIIVYSSALSSTDRAAVEQMLIAKWGIA
jgi:hypothetical protein